MGKEPLPQGVPVPMRYSAPCLALGDKGGFLQPLHPLPRSGLTLQTGVPAGDGHPGGSTLEAPAQGLVPGTPLLSFWAYTISSTWREQTQWVGGQAWFPVISFPTHRWAPLYQLSSLTLIFQKSLLSPTMSPSLSLLHRWFLASVCLHLPLSLLALRALKTRMNPKANLVSR